MMYCKIWAGYGWGLHESGAPNKVRNRQVPNGMPVIAV